MAELDPSFLRRVAAGETAALEGLARQYAGPVYRYLVRLCGDATLAEDLAQEVAIQLWRHLPGRTFPNGRALNAWIYTVATNAFRMHRRRKRAAEVPWDGEIDLPAGEESDPEQTAQRRELARQVRAAVELLPEPERQALLLKVFSDLRYGEISEVTGEPVGTVKWRISRAYARLRELLRPASSVEERHESVRSTAAVPGRGNGPTAAMAHAAPSSSVSHVLRTAGR